MLLPLRIFYRDKQKFDGAVINSRKILAIKDDDDNEIPGTKTKFLLTHESRGLEDAHIKSDMSLDQIEEIIKQQRETRTLFKISIYDNENKKYTSVILNTESIDYINLSRISEIRPADCKSVLIMSNGTYLLSDQSIKEIMSIVKNN